MCAAKVFLLIILMHSSVALTQKIANEEDVQDFHCPSRRLIERFGLNEQLFTSTCHGSTRNTSLLSLARLRRRSEPIFKGKPKPRADILANKFHLDNIYNGQTNSLVKLVHKIANEYLRKCPPIIYYDAVMEKSDGKFLEILFKTFPISFYHGELNANYVPRIPKLPRHIDNSCKSYILFLSDPMKTRQIIGAQTESRVVVISRSSQWKLRDFLSSETSSNIVNLLVIGESLMADPLRERPYVLYTHKLYTDGLGSNKPLVLTSWIKGLLSRPHINLFPPKFQDGFAGHRFQVSAVSQPPFIFRINRLDAGGSATVNWEGIEYRLLQLLAKQLNFSVEIIEPRRAYTMGIPEALQQQILTKNADMAMSGMYITEELIHNTDMSVGHSKDCAAFITLASKALPKYRAIMGPFQWPVWLALTFVYLGAIFPIVFTDRLSLKHLIGNWGEIENMFWYVFGMFTNSFTFASRYAWGNSRKTSTRLLIGSYWMFTIIITACYTGSIIAFVTLPAFPDTIDSVFDLLGLFFRVGTMDKGGWETWFHNSTHPPTAKLFNKMEYVGTLEEGIGNVTQSFFWNYAFLGSKAQLEYLVQSNFSDDNISRRSALHLSEECLAIFQIGYLFPKDAVYKRKIDSLIMLAQQSGLINKINNEVKWTMQRSTSGKLLQASASKALRERIQEERQLTTADTEGMFLLMGIGYLVGAIALISEIVGGITNKCRQIIRRSRKSIASTWSSRTNSADPRTMRSEEQQKQHNLRKLVRRQQQAATGETTTTTEQRGGFGMREFNLTRTTLKELYGNYYRTEPNYLIKHGKLILETDANSTDTTDCESLRSSADPLEPRRRTKALVLTHVDIDGASSAASESDERVQDTLAMLDNCLAEHCCDDISEENTDDIALELKDDASASITEGDDESNLNNVKDNNTDQGYDMGNIAGVSAAERGGNSAGESPGVDLLNVSDESNLFGSFVLEPEQNSSKIDNLLMFNSTSELDQVMEHTLGTVNVGPQPEEIKNI